MAERSFKNILSEGAEYIRRFETPYKGPTPLYTCYIPITKYIIFIEVKHSFVLTIWLQG